MKTIMRRHRAWILALALAGCGSQAPELGVPDPSMSSTPTSTSNPNANPNMPDPDSTATPIKQIDIPVEPDSDLPDLPTDVGLTPSFELVIPHDDRAAVQAATPPPPISGGTLLVTADGKYAVAADPDRDRLSIVDLTANQLLATLPLSPGDEPGRLVEDDAGRVHVALRRGGAVVTIDPATHDTLLARRDVCANPRGITFDASAKELVIACASGELMGLSSNPLSLLPAHQRARIEPDLRDVAVDGAQLLVSRFKRAEVVAVGADGKVATTNTPAGVTQGFLNHNGEEEQDALAPTFAWRTLRASDGSMFMLHQIARTTEIDLQTQTTGSVGQVVVSGPYGGGALQCGGVVQSALTYFDANGAPQSTVRLPGVLPVDAALSADGTRIAVVFAGSVDGAQGARSLRAAPSTSRMAVPFAGSSFAGAAPTMPALPPQSVMLIDVATLRNTLQNGQCAQPVAVGIDVGNAFEPIAVAATSTGFAVLQREPAQLLLTDGGGSVTSIELGGISVADTGHQLFHHDAGGGVACANCHAEGGEDGHVWRFSGFGPRRTQALNVGLEGTAPFHWGGDMPGMPELMEEVMVTRMGGVHESDDRQAALQRWLFALEPLSPIRANDDLAALRGQALFEGEALCSQCHSGEKLTNNVNYDVGTGESVQVPSLIGVSHRGPWLHTGCASTLRERFDPACGGETHGKTAQLSDAQIDDLVAYLETL